MARGGGVADIEQAVQQGQAKGCRLTSTGLGQTHQVSTLHDMGNGLRLNGRGRGHIGQFKRFKDFRRKAEISESRHWGSSIKQRNNAPSPLTMSEAVHIAGAPA